MEAFVHLCAAGIGPEDVWIGLIDQDINNGNLNRTRELIHVYKKARASLRWDADALRDCSFFKTDINHDEQKSLWKPIREQPATLDNFFRLYFLKSDLRQLLEFLYSRDEIVQGLDEGFRGRSNLAAAVMTARVFTGDSFWQNLYNEIRSAAMAGVQTRVFFFGSVFGGIGAAGLHILAQFIRNAANDPVSGWAGMSIGGAFMLPYYYFPPPMRARDHEGIFANSVNFLEQTKASLEYYEHLFMIQPNIFDSIYLLGSNPIIPVTSYDRHGSYDGHGVGYSQLNPPMLPELYAGLAACRFFNPAEVIPTGATPCVFRIGREGGYTFNWHDLPEATASSERGELRKSIGQLLRFCFAFYYIYGPHLQPENWRRVLDEAWFRKLIIGANVDLFGEGRISLDYLNDFTAYVLRWFAGVNISNLQEFRINLIDWSTYAEYVTGNEVGNKENMGIPVRLIGRDSLDRHFRRNFEYMIIGSRESDLADIFNKLTYDEDLSLGEGLGVFIRALYDACNLGAGESSDIQESKSTVVEPMLCPLNLGGPIVIETLMAPGVWEPAIKGVTELAAIADNINPDQMELPYPPYLTIPNVWSPEALFRDALQKCSDAYAHGVQPAHHEKRAEGNWRGLLALFALHEFFDFTLEIQPVRLQYLSKFPFDFPGKEDVLAMYDIPNFGKILDQMAPRNLTLDRGMNWDEISIIRLDGEPIALALPTVILWPKRGYSKDFDPRIPWWKDGEFRDPCEVNELPSEFYAALAFFCEDLEDNYKTHIAPYNHLFGLLLDHLHRFRKDLDRFLFRDNKFWARSDFLQCQSDIGGFPNGQTVYSWLTQSYRPG